MASSDSFLIYIRSSRDFNFALLASSDDDISSVKKKAEAQHLALFPQNGRIVAQAIKIMHKGIVYYLPDNIPVRCLFDGTKGICSLFMDAVTVTPDLAETRMHVSDICQNSTHWAMVLSLDTNVAEVLSREGVENLMGEVRQSQVSGDPSRGRDLIEGSLNQGGNTSCTSEALKRKFPGGSTNKDPVVEEMTPGVGVLGEFAEGNTKKKKSKDPSSDEVPPSSEGESPKTGDRMHDRSAAPENETAGVHLMSGSLGTWNPDAASADMVVLDAAPEGNGSYNEKENSMALEKEARKEVGCTRSTSNAVSGETSSLAPSGSDLEDGSSDKIKFLHPTDLRDKDWVTPDNQIKDNASCSLPNADIEVNRSKTKQASQPIPMTKRENRRNKITKSVDKKKNCTREKVLSSPPIRENESEIREDASKVGTSHVVMSSEVENLTCQNQLDSHLIDDPIGEIKKKKRKQEATNPDDSAHGEKVKIKFKRAVQKIPTKKLGEKFDISKSNTAGSSSTHMNEVLASRVGDSSPDFNGTKQKASGLTVIVPDELRCGRNSGSGWRCSEKVKPDSKYCSRHCNRSTSSKKKRHKSNFSEDSSEL